MADTNPDRLAAAKELAQDIATFADSLQMLDSGLLELVVISTPPNSHYYWAKESLNRGINVILEKPMALTVEHCDELMALAASKNLLLVVYQNRRFDGAITATGLVSFELPENQSLTVNGTKQSIELIGNQAFTSWHSQSRLRLGENFEDFEAVDSYALMLENFGNRVNGLDGWVLPLETSLRVAKMLDQLRIA